MCVAGRGRLCIEPTVRLSLVDLYNGKRARCAVHMNIVQRNKHTPHGQRMRINTSFLLATHYWLHVRMPRTPKSTGERCVCVVGVPSSVATLRMCSNVCSVVLCVRV